MHVNIGRTVSYALLPLALAAAAVFVQGVRFAPAARAGTPQTVVSGLDLGAVGSLTTDDYTMTGN